MQWLWGRCGAGACSPCCILSRSTSGAALSLSYGPRRPNPSRPDVPRPAGPNGAVWGGCHVSILGLTTSVMKRRSRPSRRTRPTHPGVAVISDTPRQSTVRRNGRATSWAERIGVQNAGIASHWREAHHLSLRYLTVRISLGSARRRVQWRRPSPLLLPHSHSPPACLLWHR